MKATIARRPFLISFSFFSSEAMPGKRVREHGVRVSEGGRVRVAARATHPSDRTSHRGRCARWQTLHHAWTRRQPSAQTRWQPTFPGQRAPRSSQKTRDCGTRVRFTGVQARVRRVMKDVPRLPCTGRVLRTSAAAGRCTSHPGRRARLRGIRQHRASPSDRGSPPTPGTSRGTRHPFRAPAGRIRKIRSSSRGTPAYPSQAPLANERTSERARKASESSRRASAGRRGFSHRTVADLHNGTRAVGGGVQLDARDEGGAHGLRWYCCGAIA